MLDALAVGRPAGTGGAGGDRRGSCDRRGGAAAAEARQAEAMTLRASGSLLLRRWLASLLRRRASRPNGPTTLGVLGEVTLGFVIT